MFFSDVGSVEIFLFFGSKGLPLLDDLRDEFRLSHSGELMSVFVVFLSGELSVEFGQIILVKLLSGLLLHEVFVDMLINIMNFIFFFINKPLGFENCNRLLNYFHY
jgi:hypothetical protein